MAGQNRAKHEPLPRLATMQAALARSITAHMQSEGEQETEIPGLSLYRRSSPTPCSSSTYEPKLIVFVQGEKHIHYGVESYLCDESTFLLTSVITPIESQVIVATPDRPVLALVLKIDMRVVRDIVNQAKLPPLGTPSGTRGLGIGKTSLEMLDSCVRLLDLLHTPQDIPFLNQQIQREIYYRLLTGPQGDHLRTMATLDEQSHQTAGAIAWLSANFNKPLSVEELASVARMGMPTFQHYFHLLTELTPAQYQTRLRLQMAQQRILFDGIDATRAAFEVGYENISQFKREYREFFGPLPLSIPFSADYPA